MRPKMALPYIGKHPNFRLFCFWLWWKRHHIFSYWNELVSEMLKTRNILYQNILNSEGNFQEPIF
jgi:hypothetical protein